jgi:hypothetical protein
VVENSGVGLVEGWRSRFGVGDGLRGGGRSWSWRWWCWGVGFDGEVNAATGIHGVCGMDVAGDMNRGRQ